MIGYTEYRTNLPGGQFAAFTSMRAHVVRVDGSERRALGVELTREPHAWTQFAGWSPDGRLAVIHRGWESPDNAAWEAEHRQFRMTQGWLHDVYLLEMATGALTNVAAVERVSDYNAGLFFWPGDPHKLGFEALIQGVSHPFCMDLDGRNKRDLSTGNEWECSPLHRRPTGFRRQARPLATAIAQGSVRGFGARKRVRDGSGAGRPVGGARGETSVWDGIRPDWVRRMLGGVATQPLSPKASTARHGAVALRPPFGRRVPRSIVSQ